MKSPITGKEMTLIRERRSMDFRRETFEIFYHYYKCEDSGEQFTSTALDELNMNQVYHQYRARLNIPFPEEIKNIRAKYGVSAAKMSEILGFGINSYRQYESGEVPAAANAKLIQMADDPENFIEMVDSCTSLNEDLKSKYTRVAKSLIKDKEQNIERSILKEYITSGHKPDVYSGYRIPNLEIFTGMVVFFAQRLQPYKTKMNKLLFYADFLSFRNTGYSISGIRYRAIDMGPVPENFQSLFEYLSNTGEIEIRTTLFPGGYTGEEFRAKEERPYNPGLFSDAEIETLEKVVARFKNYSASDIVEQSHKEKGWMENQDTKQLISYEYAFEMESF